MKGREVSMGGRLPPSPPGRDKKRTERTHRTCRVGGRLEATMGGDEVNGYDVFSEEIVTMPEPDPQPEEDTDQDG
jgi:hypothetical protein